MNTNDPALKSRVTSIALTMLMIAICATAAATYKIWLPLLKQVATENNKAAAAHGHDHGPKDAHAGHDEGNSLELSKAAWKNIGLKTGLVKPGNYTKTVSVPAVVAERPGRSQVEITAPLTGVVIRIYPIVGEAIRPGQPLFDLRLTHEDLVTAQRNFLQSAQELDVVNREIARLESIGEGVIAGRRVLEQKYEQQKIEGALRAQRQGLLLHGLSKEQIDTILRSRELLPTLQVVAPPFGEDSDHQHADHLYHVQSIQVKRGQSVAAGESLGVLADHCLLYVEGQAFEEDADRLIQASHENWLLDVAPVSNGSSKGKPMQLKVLYVADHIDEQSRALRFYLSLPNQQIKNNAKGNSRFVSWQFRPGQRMDVKIPIGKPWENQIVLPPDAVVSEGAEAFVFEQNGEHFDRVPVHVVYRDKDTVVVENDGKIIGSTIAMSGAYQMHLAIKNKSGGAVDPHAGHNH